MYTALERVTDSSQSYVDCNVSDNARAHLGNVYNFMPQSSQKRQTEEEKKKEKFEKFKKALAFSHMDFRRSAIRGAYSDTCQWMFGEDQYLSWLDPAMRDCNHGLLWIKGHPGTGKSTLMKCILEHLEAKDRVYTAISVFFNARGSRLEHTVEGCYRSLLYQILDSIPGLWKSFPVPALPAGNKGWEVSVVRDKIRKAILCPKDEHLVVLVDALDECEQSEVHDMMEFLGDILDTARIQGVKFNVCVASRHYPDLTISFCENISVERVAAHAADIRKYVSAKLVLTPGIQRARILQTIFTKTQNVFLWAVLVTNVLNDHFKRGASPEELEAVINILPGSLKTMMDDIVGEGASDPCFLPSILWTMVAFEMELEKIYLAIRFCGDGWVPTCGSEFMVDVGSCERFIIDASKGLVEVIEDTGGARCQFIHESVREHINGGGLVKLDPALRNNVEAAGHAVLTEWCLEYLRASTLDSAPNLRLKPGRHSWLSYVYYQTFQHLNSAYLGGSYDMSRLRKFPFQGWIQLENIYRGSSPKFVPGASILLFLLSHESLEAGDLEVTRWLIETMATCSRAHDLRSAVPWIADSHLCISSVGNDLDSWGGGPYGFALQAAVFRGDKSYTHSPAEQDPNATILSDRAKYIYRYSGRISEDDYMRLHSTAVVSATGSDDIVRLLLSHGAEVNNRESGGIDTLLATSIAQQKRSTLKIFLDSGADVNVEDAEGHNIALKAALGLQIPNHEAMVSLLFKHGAKVKPEAHAYFLHLAATRKMANVIRIMVLNGIDVRAKDRFSRTALHTLVECISHYYGRTLETAQTLLDLGLDVNAHGGEYDTALIAAAGLWHVDLVRLFLGRGANANCRSQKHGTALDAACAPLMEIPRPGQSHFTAEDRHEVITMLLEATAK